MHGTVLRVLISGSLKLHNTPYDTGTIHYAHCTDGGTEAQSRLVLRATYSQCGVKPGFEHQQPGFRAPRSTLTSWTDTEHRGGSQQPAISILLQCSLLQQEEKSPRESNQRKHSRRAGSHTPGFLPQFCHLNKSCQAPFKAETTCKVGMNSGVGSLGSNPGPTVHMTPGSSLKLPSASISSPVVGITIALPSQGCWKEQMNWYMQSA